MAISKDKNKSYNDKFIAKMAEAIGVSPFNNPESWGDDPDNDFEESVLKHPFDKNNQDDVKQYHDYFGMGIGRNGPWQPLEDDEIVEYLKNHPKEIELWVDDVDWDDEKDGSKFADKTPDDPDESSDKPHDEELAGETTPEEDFMQRAAEGKVPATSGVLAGDLTPEEVEMIQMMRAGKQPPKNDGLAGETTPEEKEMLNITNRLAKNLSKHRW